MKAAVIFMLFCAVPSSWSLPAVGDVRLTFGSPKCGRLEVFWNDTWGTVNGSGFGETNRDVVCRQLGFQNAKGCQIDPRAWLQGMGMGMNGSSEFNSPMSNASEKMHEALCKMSHCDSMPAFSIRCFGSNTMPPQPQNCTDGSVRLAGGNMTNEGQLELFWNGTWKSFCFESKSMAFMMPNFTNLVCRHLGYSDGGVPLDNSPPQWQIKARCLGNETALRDCPREIPESPDCDHDVWMSCEDVCPAMSPPSTLRTSPRTTVKPPTTTTKANFVPGKACNDGKTFKKHQTACLKWLCKKVTYRKQNKKQCKNF